MAFILPGMLWLVCSATPIADVPNTTSVLRAMALAVDKRPAFDSLLMPGIAAASNAVRVVCTAALFKFSVLGLAIVPGGPPLWWVSLLPPSPSIQLLPYGTFASQPAALLWVITFAELSLISPTDLSSNVPHSLRHSNQNSTTSTRQVPLSDPLLPDYCGNMCLNRGVCAGIPP